MIYPDTRAAPLTAAAIKASAGATEHLLLAPVDDLAGTLADLHAHGLRRRRRPGRCAQLRRGRPARPLALVVGSEGYGISGPAAPAARPAVRIPMRGKIASLNAAVAGSVLLFAAAEQRGDIAAPPPDAAEPE